MLTTLGAWVTHGMICCSVDQVLGCARQRPTANRGHRASLQGCLLSESQTLPAMVLNTVLRLVPTRVKAAIAATAINAAINAYSIAVTPDWSLTKFVSSLRNGILLGSTKSIMHSAAPKSLSNGEKTRYLLVRLFSIGDLAESKLGRRGAGRGLPPSLRLCRRWC